MRNSSLETASPHIICWTVQLRQCLAANLAREDQVQPDIIQVYGLRKAGLPTVMAYTIGNMRVAFYLQNDSPFLSSLTQAALLFLIRHMRHVKFVSLAAPLSLCSEQPSNNFWPDETNWCLLFEGERKVCI